MRGLIDSRFLMKSPKEVAVAISEAISGAAATVVTAASNLVVLEVAFAPSLELKAHGYPHEVARITQFSDVERHPVPYAIPVGAPRTWEHRFPALPPLYLDPLCLWYRNDPPALRWDWTKGFLNYVAIVQRHLWYEEHFRRTGVWATEDAPHGIRGDGLDHPVRSIYNLHASGNAA